MSTPGVCRHGRQAALPWQQRKEPWRRKERRHAPKGGSLQRCAPGGAPLEVGTKGGTVPRLRSQRGGRTEGGQPRPPGPPGRCGKGRQIAATPRLASAGACQPPRSKKGLASSPALRSKKGLAARHDGREESQAPIRHRRRRGSLLGRVSGLLAMPSGPKSRPKSGGGAPARRPRTRASRTRRAGAAPGPSKDRRRCRRRGRRESNRPGARASGQLQRAPRTAHPRVPPLSPLPHPAKPNLPPDRTEVRRAGTLLEKKRLAVVAGRRRWLRPRGWPQAQRPGGLPACPSSAWKRSPAPAKPRRFPTPPQAGHHLVGAHQIQGKPTLWSDSSFQATMIKGAAARATGNQSLL
mmetsp:Transcript_46889/g.106151  ORF Transcript_46889/g.106151 Transcript_46889/m.106151 type:complete len:351 (-) Transcript_46889:1543-2595(-)